MLENVLEPMIAKLAPHAEIHVMMPSEWIEKRVSDRTATSLEYSWHRDVSWHAIDAEGSGHDSPESDRSAADAYRLARLIAPDYCLCRSADRLLPVHLPGQVRYIMEASAPPFNLPTHWICLQPQIFDHGLLPDLGQEQRNTLLRFIGPAWHRLETSGTDHANWRADRQLPSDKFILALPLEYDHPDNVFARHRIVRSNPVLIERLADGIDDAFRLAVTDHPLNIQFLDRMEIAAAVEAKDPKVRLLDSAAERGETTVALARHCDGMIVGDSKSFAAAAFYGKPLLRMSRFESGAWLKAYDDIDRFLCDLSAGTAVSAKREDAMVWFAHYLTVQAFAPRDSDVAGDEIVERVMGDTDRERWPRTWARVAGHNNVSPNKPLTAEQSK